MGATSASKCSRVVANVRIGLAIEMLVAAQGLDAVSYTHLTLPTSDLV